MVSKKRDIISKLLGSFVVHESLLAICGLDHNIIPYGPNESKNWQISFLNFVKILLSMTSSFEL